MEYRFDWDPQKDKANQRKHRLSFRQAATIFFDSKQLSIFDDAHSDEEDRWITIGLDNLGNLQVVVHTFESVSEDLCRIRIISARSAESDEQAQYLEMQDESEV